MRYFVNIKYDGSKYYGWSKQKHKDTIQDHIELKLFEIFKDNINIYSSGRTDRGVHALNQYFHFEVNMKIELEKLVLILNRRINKDILIKKITIVDKNFHARYSAKNKTYEYIINNGDIDPFVTNYEYFFRDKIDIKIMQTILNNFIGEHDFSSFASSFKSNNIRVINWIKVLKNGKKIKIRINGNGFLRYMVRMIVGYSLIVYAGKKTEDSIMTLLKNPSKGACVEKAPSNGLYLYNVHY